MEDKVTDIEIHLAHLQRTVDELNDIVVQQGKEIDRLKKNNRLLKESIDAQIIKNEEDEVPPPHY